MHSIRIKRFGLHENVYTQNYTVNLYALDFMQQMYARNTNMLIQSVFNYDRKI